jgi:hypothetical protein
MAMAAIQNTIKAVPTQPALVPPSEPTKGFAALSCSDGAPWRPWLLHWPLVV